MKQSSMCWNQTNMWAISRSEKILCVVLFSKSTQTSIRLKYFYFIIQNSTTQYCEILIGNYHLY